MTFSVQSNAGSPAVAVPASGSSIAPVAKATGPAGVQVTYTPDLTQVNGQVLSNFLNALTVTPGAPAEHACFADRRRAGIDRLRCDRQHHSDSA